MTRPELRDPGHQARLAERGCAVVDLLAAEEVGALLDAHQSSAAPQPGFSSTVLSGDSAHRAAVDAAIRSIIERPLAAVVTGWRLVFCTFVAKAPSDGASAVPMHQDWSFVDEGRFTALGVWCPTVDMSAENGCLQIVEGSHRLAHPHRPACTPFFYKAAERELRRHLTNVPMRAGQAAVFDQRLFHCSPPNRSPVERVAATALLVPGDAPLRYYHAVTPRDPSVVEVFEVPDTFYLHHPVGTRPASGTSLGVFRLEELGSFCFQARDGS